MAAKKQLREGVTEQGCQVNVCKQDARRLYKEGEYQAALESYQAVAEKMKDDPAFLLDRGVDYYALGRFELALADFDKVLAADPALRAGAERAHTLMRLGRWSDARAVQKLMDQSVTGRVPRPAHRLPPAGQHRRDRRALGRLGKARTELQARWRATAATAGRDLHPRAAPARAGDHRREQGRSPAQRLRDVGLGRRDTAKEDRRLLASTRSSRTTSGR
jgi:tetratricopeptide (TPR) repeat protein